MNIAGNYPITQQYFCILGGFAVLVKLARAILKKWNIK